MNQFRQNFRLWWQPPRRTSDREEERRVSFLELFYDLVKIWITMLGGRALTID